MFIATIAADDLVFVFMTMNMRVVALSNYGRASQVHVVVHSRCCLMPRREQKRLAQVCFLPVVSSIDTKSKLPRQ
jgi:hypothetical protein